MATEFKVAPVTDDELFDLRREFNLPLALGRILALLLESRNVTDEDLVARGITAGGSSPKVEISRLRKRLSSHGVTIHSMRDMGYWLTDATKGEILSRLPTRVNQEPTNGD